MEPTPLRGSLPSVLHLSRTLSCSWLSPPSSKAAVRKWMQPPISLCETGGQSPFQFHLSTYGTKDVATKRLTVLNWEIVWVCVCVSLCVNFSLHPYRLSSCKSKYFCLFFPLGKNTLSVSSTTENISKND